MKSRVVNANKSTNINEARNIICVCVKKVCTDYAVCQLERIKLGYRRECLCRVEFMLFLFIPSC